MYDAIRQRLFDILEVPSPTDRLSKVIDLSLLVLILLNVLAVVFETVPSIERRYALLLRWFDTISVSIFTVEYVLRLWICTQDERYRRPIRGRRC